MKYSIGKKIKKHRKQKKLTFETLAKLSKVSKSYLWELEHDNSKPSAEILERIADNLSVTTSYLLNNNQGRLSEDDKDEVFYRDYKKLSEDQKGTMRALLEFLSSEKGQKFKVTKNAR